MVGPKFAAGPPRFFFCSFPISYLDNTLGQFARGDRWYRVARDSSGTGCRPPQVVTPVPGGGGSARIFPPPAASLPLRGDLPLTGGGEDGPPGCQSTGFGISRCGPAPGRVGYPTRAEAIGRGRRISCSATNPEPDA